MSSNVTKAIRLALFGAIVIALAACGDASPAGPVVPPPPVAVAAVQVSAPRLTLVVGEQVQLVATPKSSRGEVLAGRTVTFESATPGLATVTGNGVVNALGEGTVVVRAASEGVVSTIELTVAPSPATSLEVDVAQFSRAEGEVMQLQAIVRNATGAALEGRTVTWLSSDPQVASVTASGLVTMLRQGTARIIARHAGLVSESRVQVTPDFGADLVFDMKDGTPFLPRLYASDSRFRTATPVAVLGTNGNWDVSVSRSGDRLVFTCLESGSAICVSDRYGQGVRVLTGGDAAYEDQPALSPDGTLIAYRRYPHGGTPGFANPTEIWVMNVDGSNQRNVTNDNASQHQPTWSPVSHAGGMRIAFVHETMVGGYRVSHLQSIRADGSGRGFLTPGGTDLEEGPSWSPDGARIVFTRSGGEISADLMVLNVNTGAVTPLLAAPLADEQHGAAWSPDGRHVAFVSTHETSDDGGYRQQVWTVRADGSGLSRRTDLGGAKANPAWLPRP